MSVRWLADTILSSITRARQSRRKKRTRPLGWIRLGIEIATKIDSADYCIERENWDAPNISDRCGDATIWLNCHATNKLNFVRYGDEYDE